jgi:type III secretory pathway lipoprotein EscJ
MNEDRVKQCIQENNALLLGQIKDLVSSSVSDLKRANEETASEYLGHIKKLRRDPKPSFKKKSNEDQYSSNKEIMEHVEDA